MSADPYAIPDNPITYWEDLGFEAWWGMARFGRPLTLHVKLPELDIFFVGEGRNADEVFDDAWRHYVAFHIDTVMAWAEAKERVEPFGLQVTR